MISKSESNKIYYQKNKDRLAEKWKNDESRKAYLREYYKRIKRSFLKELESGINATKKQEN